MNEQEKKIIYSRYYLIQNKRANKWVFKKSKSSNINYFDSLDEGINYFYSLHVDAFLWVNENGKFNRTIKQAASSGLFYSRQKIYDPSYSKEKIMDKSIDRNKEDDIYQKEMKNAIRKLTVLNNSNESSKNINTHKVTYRQLDKELLNQKDEVVHFDPVYFDEPTQIYEPYDEMINLPVEDESEELTPIQSKPILEEVQLNDGIFQPNEYIFEVLPTTIKINYNPAIVNIQEFKQSEKISKVIPFLYEEELETPVFLPIEENISYFTPNNYFNESLPQEIHVNATNKKSTIFYPREKQNSQIDKVSENKDEFVFEIYNKENVKYIFTYIDNDENKILVETNENQDEPFYDINKYQQTWRFFEILNNKKYIIEEESVKKTIDELNKEELLDTINSIDNIEINKDATLELDSTSVLEDSNILLSPKEQKLQEKLAKKQAKLDKKFRKQQEKNVRNTIDNDEDIDNESNETLENLSTFNNNESMATEEHDHEDHQENPFGNNDDEDHSYSIDEEQKDKEINQEKSKFFSRFRNKNK